MLEQTIMSGFGGQGVISMGQIWVYSAMKEEKNVTYFPFYGAEKRGGIARASVIVSTEEIDSPLVSSPQSIVIMNNDSLKIYEDQVKPGGKIFVNSDLVTDEVARKDVKVYKIPANSIATELGTVKAANIVMLGAFAEATGAVAAEHIIGVIPGFFPPEKQKFVPMNQDAIRKGQQFVKDNY